jgi:hypothetical protein
MSNVRHLLAMNSDKRVAILKEVVAASKYSRQFGFSSRAVFVAIALHLSVFVIMLPPLSLLPYYAGAPLLHLLLLSSTTLLLAAGSLLLALKLPASVVLFAVASLTSLLTLFEDQSPSVVVPAIISVVACVVAAKQTRTNASAQQPDA